MLASSYSIYYIFVVKIEPYGIYNIIRDHSENIIGVETFECRHPDFAIQWRGWGGGWVYLANLPVDQILPNTNY